MMKQAPLRMLIMKKTLLLIKNIATNDMNINGLLQSYEDNCIDEDTLISNVILTLSTEQSNSKENDDDIKLDLMTW